MQSEKCVSSLSQRLRQTLIKDNANPAEDGEGCEPPSPVDRPLTLGRLGGLEGLDASNNDGLLRKGDSFSLLFRLRRGSALRWAQDKGRTANVANTAGHGAQLHRLARDVSLGDEEVRATLDLDDAVMPGRGNVEEVAGSHRHAVGRETLDDSDHGGVEELDAKLRAGVVVTDEYVLVFAAKKAMQLTYAWIERRT